MRIVRPRSAGRVLTVASAATFLALVVFTTPLAALPSTAAAVGAGPEGQAWILSSMSIGLAVALLPVGALGDDRGRRRVLVAGAVLLAAASVLAALAPSAVVLVVARIVQGIGAAALVSCSQGLLGHAFPAGTPGAGTASSLWGASVGAGIAVGPLAATGLERLAAWNTVYGVEAVAAVVLAVVTRFAVAESRSSTPRPIDLPGVAVLGLGLASLLAGLTEARSGLGAGVVALLVGGIVLLGLFVLVERRGPSSTRGTPMLDLGLFASPGFVAATVVERGLGRSAVVGALLLGVWSGTSVVTALLARRLPARWSGRWRLACGLGVVAVGQVLLVGLDPASSPASLVPGLALAGAASGLINSSLGREAVTHVPADRAAMGGGANNTARYVGSAVGVTVVAVVATRPGLGGGPAAAVAGWNDAVLVATAFSVLGALAVAACRPWRGGQVEGQDHGHGQDDARRDTGTAQDAVQG